MKIVANRCFGGFGLSPLALKRLAELQGRTAYFFTQEIKHGLDSAYNPATLEQAQAAFMFFAFDIPNPNEVLPKSERWNEMTLEQRKEHDDVWRSHRIGDFGDDRSNALLVRVVEELGARANGKFANLDVVEIPDDVEWQIDEYDGSETVREKSREW